ncbi:MAG: hypothetical protein ACLPPF_23630 [Rhodomicrobium sp.]
MADRDADEIPATRMDCSGRRKPGNALPGSREQLQPKRAWPRPSPYLFLLFSVFASSLILAPVLAGHRSILAHGLGSIYCGIGLAILGALIAVNLMPGGRQK